MPDDRITVTDYYKRLDNGKIIHFRKVGNGPVEFVTDDAPVVLVDAPNQLQWEAGKDYEGEK